MLAVLVKKIGSNLWRNYYYADFDGRICWNGIITGIDFITGYNSPEEIPGGISPSGGKSAIQNIV
jgi:hypothetical protein